MTDTPMAIEVNCATGEVIERPLTAEEISQREADAAAQAVAQAAREAEEAQKATARAAILSRLGLTEEEAQILLT
jgi:acyl-CoA reductase-like NAD-dependent aldehyde dehydrogenase